MPTTVRTFQASKDKGQRIVMLTAYDYQTARLLDEAGIPALLVGDSLGMVMLGYESTVRVTMDDILHHTKAVVRGVKNAMVIADLPFMSYQVSAEQALVSAGRLLQEGGAHAVKLEGGQAMAGTVRRLVEAGIPVMGHIGLTPQSINQFGGYRVQGKTATAAQALLEDALALQEAGAFAIVLELVSMELSELISRRLTVPTIGIGAGPGCDGQVQVITDLLGYDISYIPRHAQRYGRYAEMVAEAARQYKDDVSSGRFPSQDHGVSVDAQLLAGLSASPTREG